MGLPLPTFNQLTRAFPGAPVELALTQQEEILLNQLVDDAPSTEQFSPLHEYYSSWRN